MPLISEISAKYKTNNIKLYVVSKEDEQLNKDIIRRIISKLFVLIDLFTNAKIQHIIYMYGYLISKNTNQIHINTNYINIV